MKIRDINLSSCPSTDILAGLNKQLVQKLNAIAPGKLVSIEDLIASGKINPKPSVLPFVGGPTAKARLLAAINDRAAANGSLIPLPLNSAYRTVAQQFLLRREFDFGPGKCNMSAVANPGTSNHESGLAIDIDNNMSWQPYLRRRSWFWIGAFDPPHFDFVGGTDLRQLNVKAFQSLWNDHNPGDQLQVDGSFGTNPPNSQTWKRLLKTPVDGFS
jgi:hypothetical protein